MSSVNAFVSALVLASSAALAQVTLSGSATADNLFTASVSTSATDAGTAWFSGNSWPTTYTSTTNISEPGEYFLHVRAQDQGRPEMFIGRFTLTGINATFANGTQTLVTNATDWEVSTVGFGLTANDPVVIGPNGISPWGPYAAMPEASFIWAPVYADGVAFFTARFTVVPAPSVIALAGAGLIAVRRRR